MRTVIRGSMPRVGQCMDHNAGVTPVVAQRPVSMIAREAFRGSNWVALARMPRRYPDLLQSAGRYTLEQAAVADRAGTVAFGVESTGRYGGIGVATAEAIEVRCLEINEVLE